MTAQSIHVLVAKILDELPAIGKNQKNSQQGYMFRGIDDVLDALNPLLGTHGVFVVPEALERVSEQRSTSKGGVSNVVHLRVRFRLYGPAGDYIEGSTWGEGSDSGDKATSKAHTMAFKYFLFELFAISTAEQADADNDRHTAPETVRVTYITPKTAAAFRESADARGLDLGSFVLDVTGGRTSVLTEVHEGDERRALKDAIAARPVADPVADKPVQPAYAHGEEPF